MACEITDWMPVTIGTAVTTIAAGSFVTQKAGLIYTIDPPITWFKKAQEYFYGYGPLGNRYPDDPNGR